MSRAHRLHDDLSRAHGLRAHGFRVHGSRALKEHSEKTGALECENHRTISLMSHFKKILLRFELNKWKSKIENKISSVQSSFIEEKRSRNVMPILKNLVGRGIEMHVL